MVSMFQEGGSFGSERGFRKSSVTRFLWVYRMVSKSRERGSFGSERGFKVSSDTVSLGLKNGFKVSGKRFLWL